MEQLSSPSTAWTKRLWGLGPVAISAFAVAPSVMDGTFRRSLGSSLVALALLVCVWAFFIAKARIFNLADEVLDGGDHLQIRRLWVKGTVPLASVLGVEASTFSGIERVILRLAAPSALGARVEFVPKRAPGPRAAGTHPVADDLAARAQRARSTNAV